jgi:hypothetical protein
VSLVRAALREAEERGTLLMALEALSDDDLRRLVFGWIRSDRFGSSGAQV